MPGIAVVGAQWGDEGKGKLVDVFSQNSDMVVRFQGGANAGHTLVVNGQKTILHLIPSGILHPSTQCVIAPGVVMDVFSILDEIKKLKSAGLLKEPQQLQISDSVSLILPYHKLLDSCREKDLSAGRIGTTGKGIGPAYEDRAGRKSILLRDLYDSQLLQNKLQMVLKEKNALLTNLYGESPVGIEGLISQLLAAAEEIAPFRCADTSLLIHKTIKAGKKVLFEGAQGTMLDVYHGTYPFVTSSSTLAGAASISSGIGPSSISQVIGVFKAYTTRVGSGPFPTELDNEVGEKLRREGHEFGSTTGRARRCGWLDLVALRYAIRLNGITNLALMKLDVLSGHDRIALCTGYRVGQQVLTEMPTDLESFSKAEPVLEYFPGWSQDLTKAMSLRDLPRAAINYIDTIGNFVGTPIDVVSVGPGREQTLWVKPLFN